MPSILARLRSADSQRGWSTGSGWGIPIGTYNGVTIFGQPQTTMPGGDVEALPTDFAGIVGQVHRRSGVVAAAVVARGLLMGELVYKWSLDSDPGRLFGNRDLRPIEDPRTMTRQHWMMRVEQDVAYHGNHYTRRTASSLQRLRPDWVDLIVGSDENPDNPRWAADATLLFYVYWPGGRNAGQRGVILDPSEIIHFAPEPHPEGLFIGEAWVTGVLREALSDIAAGDYVANFWANSATPNLVITAPEGITPEQFTEFLDAVEDEHRGVANAWRNLYLAGGSDVEVVGADLSKLNLKDVQGGHETRVAARSRVPATILQAREGMQGSALNAGNYTATRRMWADAWFSPYARGWCQAAQRILSRPAGASLSYDPAQVMFLQEDRKDAADILVAKATAIETLYRAGMDQDAAVEAIMTEDLSKLIGQNTGLASVQANPDALPPGGGDD